MFVGSDIINTDKLNAIATDFEKLDNYAMSLIPLWARSIKEVVDNQKYLVALYIKKSNVLTFKEKHAAVQHLCEGIHLSGLLNTVTKIEDIFKFADKNTLLSALRR